MTGTTALYARVSTADQSLDRQKEETWTYATETLDVDPTEIEVYQDTGTGRDTQRDGYQELMRDVRAGEVARVIVLEVSRLSRSCATSRPPSRRSSTRATPACMCST